MAVEHWVDLRCHPATHAAAVRAIKVGVRRSAGAELKLTFRLDGDIRAIQVPAPRAPHFATDLWRHTCFEAFVAIEAQPAYCEFNFAPSGEWAAYAFSSYRNGGPIPNVMISPPIAMRSTDTLLELETLVRLDSLPAIDAHNTVLRVGLSAVIESRDGFSYWALAHPPGKPDFHRADSFVLLLAPPDVER